MITDAHYHSSKEETMFEHAEALVRSFYADLFAGGSIHSAALDGYLAAAFRGHHLPPGFLPYS